MIRPLYGDVDEECASSKVHFYVVASQELIQRGRYGQGFVFCPYSQRFDRIGHQIFLVIRNRKDRGKIGEAEAEGATSILVYDSTEIFYGRLHPERRVTASLKCAYPRSIRQLFELGPTMAKGPCQHNM